MRMLLAMMILLSASAYAEQEEVLVDCWDAVDSELCGEPGYTCRSFGSLWTESCDFKDPLPEGSTVTKIEATFYGQECGLISVQPDINGASIGMTDSDGGCAYDQCSTWSCGEDFTDNGMPQYNYGGTNTLSLNSGEDGALCLSKVKLTIDYEGEPIPEFGAVAAGLALMGAGAGYLLLRRK